MAEEGEGRGSTTPGPSPSSPHGAPSSPDLWLGLGVAATTFLIGWLTWHPVPVGVWHDDGAYLLIARALAEGRGLVWDGVAGGPPAAKFPPLFPWLASWVLRAGVDAERAARPLAMLNIGVLSASLGVFTVVARRLLTVPPWVAGALGLTVGTCVGFWRLTAVPHSEPLFMLGTAAALLALTFARPGEVRVRWGLIAAFLAAFAVAYHSRTAAVSLGAAGGLAWFAARRPREGAITWMACAALALPWMVWSRSATQAIAEPLRDVLGGYGSWWAAEVGRAPGGVPALVLGGASGVAGDLTDVLFPALGPFEGLRDWIALLVVGLTVVAALRVLLRGTSHALPTSVAGVALGAFVLLYLVLIALWPFRAQRLVLPVVPWIVLTWMAAVLPERSPEPSEATGAESAGQRPATVGLFTGPWARVGVGLLAAWAMLFAGTQALGLYRGTHLAAYQARAADLLAAVDAVRRFTPPDAVVGAPELWPGLAIHAGREVAPSARFLPLAQDGPSWGTPLQQVQLWRQAGIDHVVVEHGGGVHGTTLDRMDAECGTGAVALLATIPAGFVVRVSPSERCEARLAAGPP